MESIFLVNYLTNFIQLMILRLLKFKKLHIYFTTFYYKGLKSPSTPGLRATLCNILFY